MVNFAAYCNIVCVCVFKMVNFAAYCNIVCVCVCVLKIVTLLLIVILCVCVENG